jgi:cellulose synthase/poly-beta-1,6-N-acetylglucosamine synthase-like glycosyltransferase
MDWYYYIAWIAILSQLIFLHQMCRNYRYVLNKYRRERPSYRPKTVLIVPCKGLDENFENNISSFFLQDYEEYLLWFVVEDQGDPAYSKLCELSETFKGRSKAVDVKVLVAGKGENCSQKIHNLLYCYEQIGDDIEVMAFADSDACLHSDWLSHIVYPLRKSKNGAASGYRWFIPKTGNFATLALSALNAKIAQLLGNTHFNQVWGGSMSIKVEVFRKIGLDKIWPKTLSDDLSLSVAVKKAGLKVSFVPRCLVASYESVTWAELFEFGRRQFVITRVAAPWTWWFGLLSCLYSISGLWIGLALAIYATMIGSNNLLFYAAVPVLFFTGQVIRAILRQAMIYQVLQEHNQHMKSAMMADIGISWLWTLVLFFLILSSAFGRTIVWRGIRYKILGPAETIVINGVEKHLQNDTA